ncbi:hypothetical protein B0T22DRAFT_30016 [Podospora appendiculata]|uniref:Uncharacterized protein n=1 Tax=Podospora appendiculata TaxID=314037 RepID=A0AAE0XG98_9PEZI|nr:hypothetical protein B0T22DRAFT_30016 [Podospora appendiculata]
MAPIPVYTTSPINAAKADGVTPKTAEAAPAAQPGANIDPQAAAPTGSAPNSNQRYAPVQPTPTRPLPGNYYPPPPQPGAVPSLPTQTRTISPPPKAGERYHASPPAPEPTQGPQIPGVTSPPQMTMPPPPMGYSHSQRGTTTATAAAPSPYNTQPTQICGGLPTDESDNLSHPPGYQQDIHALDYGNPQQGGGGQNASSSAFGSRSKPQRTADTYDEDEGVLSSAMKWAQAAGQKLSAAESEVWRRINKD